MKIRQLVAFISFAVLTFSFAAQADDPPAIEQTTDHLFSDLCHQTPTTNVNKDIPVPFTEEFAVTEPQLSLYPLMLIAPPENAMMEVDITDGRAPASQAAKSRFAHALPAKTSAKNFKAARNSKALPAAKSRLPSSVDLGVEMRLRTARDASTFWVVRRGEKYNVLYANSGGSKTSIDISNSQFNELYEAARDAQMIREPQSIKPSNVCSGSIVQLFVVAKAHPEQVKTTCVDGNHRASAAMNKLGFMLASFVR